MSRWLLHLLPVLLPFVLYGLYIWLLHTGEKRGWRSAPLGWLAAAGLALSIVSFVVLGLMAGDPAGSAYSPAQYEDGVLIPGRIR